MGKKLILAIILLALPFSTVHALDRAYSFVVWKGNVYEVKLDSVLDEKRIGNAIGKVTTTPDQMTGNYYGNASNVYPIGTQYYAIKDVPTTEVIAVQVDGHWLEAHYLHKAPAHIMNLVGHPLFFAFIIVMIISMLCFVKRSRAEPFN